MEFAAQFTDGLPELNLPAEEQLSWIAYYSIDVIGAALGALLLVAMVSRWLVRRVWDGVNGRGTMGREKKVQ